MSEPYTPGPWEIDPNSGPGIGWSMLAKQGPVCVCPAKAYSEPDAHLIAAAPELYEALAEALQWIKGWDPNFIHDDEWQATRDKIDAALSRARGEAS